MRLRGALRSRLGAGAACSLLVLSAASVVMLVFGVTAAHAELTFSTKFGSSGPAEGQFAGPQGIGVDQTTLNPTSGDVYVADTGNARVEQFDSGGKFIRMWGWGVADGSSSFEVCTSACHAGIPGAGAGQLSSPTSVAVDNSSDSSQGDVYVGDSANNIVDKFSPSGSLLATLTGPSPGVLFSSVAGVAIDQSGDLWVLDGGTNIVSEFNSAGTLLSQFNAGGCCMVGIAADATGDVYITRFYPDTERWTPAARLQVAGGVADSAGGTGVAANPVTGDLYVDLGGSIDELEAGSTSPENFGSGSLSRGAQAAYDPNVTLPGAEGPGALYVADQGGNDVAMFMPSPQAAPVVLPGSESATNVTPSSATVLASINANGLDTHYVVEYGPTTAYGTQVPVSPGVDIGGGHGAVAFAFNLSGLSQSTTYHFRVVATNSLGTTDGQDATFTTPPSAALDQVFATNVTATAAGLEAKINPEGVETSYSFEYGTTPSYGSKAPMPAGTIDAAGSDQTVAVQIQNLQPDTKYYFRVVTTNTYGTANGSAQTFTTFPLSGEASALPDGRVYELVSPPEKNGGDVGSESIGLLPSGLGESSVSGSTAVFASFAAFGDAQGSAVATQYRATRGPTGWTTHAISPPVGVTVGLNIEIRYYIFTPELTAGVVRWLPPALVASAPQEFENLYVRDFNTGAYQLVTTVAPPNFTPGEEYRVQVLGASTDLSHVVFEAEDALAPGAPARQKGLYEWTEGGLRLVNVLPGPGNVAATSPGIGDGEAHVQPDAVSSDGARIFWTGTEGEGEGEHGHSHQLYVRENGTTTIKLNASQRTPSLGDGEAQFMAATPSGSKVFFTDSEPLTNGAGDKGGGLYEYDFSDGKLTDLSPDSGGSPGVAGVIGVSEDGMSVYFIARESLAKGATQGGENLYLADGDAIKLVATLSSSDSQDWFGNFEGRTASVTPDGRHLAFMSVAPLTGYDNIDINTGQADSEVFVYDAGAERLVCVSCNPSGEPPIGSSQLATAGLRGRIPRYISTDGQRVFFESTDALLPAATNGKQNVYEYENGAVHLISPGTSSAGSVFADATPNGDNAFFTTRAQLVPEDVDTYSDLYDARVGGGFPPVPPAPAPCLGEECRGPLSAPSASLTISTEASGAPEADPAQPATPPQASPAGGKAKKPSHKSKTGQQARKARVGGLKRVRGRRSDRGSSRRKHTHKHARSHPARRHFK